MSDEDLTKYFWKERAEKSILFLHIKMANLMVTRTTMEVHHEMAKTMDEVVEEN